MRSQLYPHLSIAAIAILSYLSCMATLAQTESNTESPQAVLVKLAKPVHEKINTTPPSPRRADGTPSGPAGDSSIKHVPQEINYEPYLQDVYRRINRAWFPPKNSFNKNVIVELDLSNQGQLLRYTIVTSSGIPAADQAVLKAVENASPFRPLPDRAPAQITAQLKFKYDKEYHTGEGLLDDLKKEYQAARKHDSKNTTAK